MCGEQVGFISKIPTQLGSPPRVRGTVASAGSQSSNLRITPACAGNSRAAYIHLAAARDHPRVCGEQPPFWYTGGTEKGSPPRVRGTGRREWRTWGWKRITPACAGNSPRFRRCRWWPKDHPRVCGEQATLLVARISEAGSPPRVRGTDNDGIPRLQSHGITPACAGNRSTLAYQAAMK